MNKKKLNCTSFLSRKCLSVLFTALMFILCSLVFSCSPPAEKNNSKKILKDKSEQGTSEPPRILLVNSYHYQFPWTRGITNGVASFFNVVLDDEGEVASVDNSTVELRILYMDTKRNTDEHFIQNSAAFANKEINKWQPDIVITSDDNAAKYLIVPYLKDGAVPVIFCGINWSVDEYGFPASNVTGMIEVQLVGQLITIMKQYAKGKKIAFLKGDDYSARKEARFYEERYGVRLDKRFVTDFAQWKAEYVKLQNEADMLLLGNSAGVRSWDDDGAKQLVASKTRIPTGNWDSWMAPYSLITLATKPEEQGVWAAMQALNIIQGLPVSSIEITENKIANVYLNMALAQKLGITFPVNLIDQATLVH